MRLEELRRRNSITQTELAIMVGVQQNTVSQWESGKWNPNVQMLMRLAEIFHCTIDALYGRDGAEREHGVPRKPSEAVCVGEEERRNE